MENQVEPGKEDNTVIISDVKVTKPTTWKWGMSSFNKPTPEFASTIFNLYFIISKAIVGWLAYTHLVDKDSLYEIVGVILLLVDPIIRGITKMFGIVVDEGESEDKK